MRKLFTMILLAGVTAFAAADGGFDASQCFGRKCPAYRAVIGRKMARKAFQARRRR